MERRSGVESFASNSRKQSHEDLHEYKAFTNYHQENESRRKHRVSESSEFSFKKNAKQHVIGKESFQEECSVFQRPDNFENIDDLTPNLEIPVLQHNLKSMKSQAQHNIGWMPEIEEINDQADETPN